MEESSGFGFPTPEPRIDLEMELEQRVLGLRYARKYCINETQEERSKRIEARPKNAECQ